MPNPILPLTTPQYLTEQMFISLGFFTGSANHAQIQAAFTIAENQVALTIGTFLTPTTFTGTYSFDGFGSLYQAPVGNIISIDSVTLRETYIYGSDRLISGSAVVTDPFNGYFSIYHSFADNSACGGCGSSVGIPTFQAVITAGYQANIFALSPQAQLASCMAADIAMKMMYDEGIGVQYENLTKALQVGRVIQSFESKFFMNTLFGPSSRANYISNLLSPYKIIRAGKLGS